MKLLLELALSCAAALVAIVLAYADLRHGVVDMQTFKKDAQVLYQKAARKIEKLEIRVSHLQSWSDEARMKK